VYEVKFEDVNLEVVLFLFCSCLIKQTSRVNSRISTRTMRRICGLKHRQNPSLPFHSLNYFKAGGFTSLQELNMLCADGELYTIDLVTCFHDAPRSRERMVENARESLGSEN
jgi:hypothetical protein